jgi:hypothetical protein
MKTNHACLSQTQPRRARFQPLCMAFPPRPVGSHLATIMFFSAIFRAKNSRHWTNKKHQNPQIFTFAPPTMRMVKAMSQRAALKSLEMPLQ